MISREGPMDDAIRLQWTTTWKMYQKILEEFGPDSWTRT
jgi:hypothetical protein